MPYADPEKRRAYQREYQRMRRAGLRKTLSQPLIPAPLRIQTAQDILALLAEQVAAVRADPEAGTLEKARCVGYLCGIALKAVEVADLSARVEELERLIREERAAG